MFEEDIRIGSSIFKTDRIDLGHDIITAMISIVPINNSENVKQWKTTILWKSKICCWKKIPEKIMVFNNFFDAKSWANKNIKPDKKILDELYKA